MFAYHLGIRPWEIEKLTVADFDALVEYAEEAIIGDGS